MARRALCLVNPKAKNGEESAERLRALLGDAEFEAQVLLTRSEHDAERRLRSLGDDFDLVMIGGGDGTLSRLSAAVLDSGKPLGILPLGTANDLARSLGIPADLKRAVEVIRTGRKAAIDVGVVSSAEGERLFLNVASIGLAAKVAQFHKGKRKKLLGVFAYPLSWWDACRASRPLRLTLSLDGKPRRCRSVQLAIGCGRHYGGGLTVDEEASHFDGLLHLYTVPPVPVTAWLTLLPALRFGRLRKEREVTVWTGREVRVETRRPREIDVDGDLAARTPAVFTVRPAALPVFLPEETLRQWDAADRAAEEDGAGRQGEMAHEDPQG